jgi:predicted RNA-binding Zn-ribbon protein involved in translation (DUF1610 family)
LDENKLIELLVRIKDIEITITDICKRLIELEKKVSHVGNPSIKSIKQSSYSFKSQKFKKFQGAIFSTKKRGIGYDTVLCETCRVELFSQGDDLMSCPKCGKSHSFNRSDMLKMVQALNSGKAE